MQIDIDVPSNVRVAAALKGGPEHEFFTVMDGVTVKEDRNKYPDFVFLFKGDSLVMGIEKLKDIWCSYGLLWSKIEPHFDYSYGDTQRFVKRMVEEHFKLKDVTFPEQLATAPYLVEKHFKLKDVAAWNNGDVPHIEVEEYFKLKGVKPTSAPCIIPSSVEDHFKLNDVTPKFLSHLSEVRVKKHFKLKDVTPGPFI